MINIYATLSHIFLKVAIGNRIANIEEHRIKHDTFGEMGPFESDRRTQSPHPIMCTEATITQQK